jgi:ribosomal protein S6
MINEINENTMNNKGNEFYRHYFVTFLIKSSVSEDKVNTLIGNIFKDLESLCEVIEMKMCGKKRLAYYIKKQNSAIFFTTVIKLKDEENLKKKLKEIERQFKLTEEILRYLINRYDYKEGNLPDNLHTMKTHIDPRILSYK